MFRKSTLPELLAPAGDMTCLYAAVAAGANYAKEQGMLHSESVIAAPHPELWEQL